MVSDLIVNSQNCWFWLQKMLSVTYYAHLSTALAVLLVGGYVYFRNRYLLASKILLAIAVFFSLWAIGDLLIWIAVDSRRIMFLWSLINIIEMITAALTLYLVFVLIEKRDVSWMIKAMFVIPIIIFTAAAFSNYNLRLFDDSMCEAREGWLVGVFHAVEILFFLTLFWYLGKKIVETKGERRRYLVFLSIGAILFLGSFSGTNLISTLLAWWHPDNYTNWFVAIYGMFGMPIFMAALAYFLVNDKTINVKLLGAQVLVMGVIFLVGSQLFLKQSSTNGVVTMISLILTLIFGGCLLAMIAKEIQQRQELTNAAEMLRHANGILSSVNNQRANLLLVAAEQLKNNQQILASEKGDNLQQLVEENRKIIQKAIEFGELIDFEQGGVKLNLTAVSLNDLVEEVVEAARAEFFKKGIDLNVFKSKVPENVAVDKDKIRLILAKILNNALNYSSKNATVEVKVHNDYEGMTVWVKENGIGFSKEEGEKLWQKFWRGEEARQLNPEGVGLSLYWCKKVVEAHKGKVFACSQGLGKGASFSFFVPFEGIV